MAKDPAFLFYSSDFLTGTMLMTNDQVGKYIRLLCYQHQKGRFSEKDMLSICKAYDEDVLSKFSKDEAGRYFNERLEKEMDKRRLYTESRRNNAKHPKKKEAYANHMDNHMENENENRNTDVLKDRGVGKGFVKPDKHQLTNYFVEIGLDDFSSQGQSSLFLNFYESNGWKVGRNPMKDWKAAARNSLNWSSSIKNHSTNGKAINNSPRSSKSNGTDQLLHSINQDLAARGAKNHSG